MKECELPVINGGHTFGILVVITIKQQKNSERAADFLTDFFANTAQLTFSNFDLNGNVINAP